MDKTDEGLLGNEKIEDAIAALQQQPTQELLAHALTVVDEITGSKNLRRKELVGGFYQLRRRIERRQKCYVNLYDRHWKIT